MFVFCLHFSLLTFFCFHAGLRTKSGELCKYGRGTGPPEGNWSLVPGLELQKATGSLSQAGKAASFKASLRTYLKAGSCMVVQPLRQLHYPRKSAAGPAMRFAFCSHSVAQ